ncbi:putative ubiquinone biosynthesis methyltransferase Coq5 [Piedraia hortae CBS 480.64]|uniref:2-methoxy-6-polyprenyl-1,4-benzoquinol methylase, mitochondrial n=1 Tax=Piedraia hortae CBS 480.64 TaxID=1314780 RepID=A0A6A7BR76_9PEZI|nr:putative ubiquinone biosynthesis methyltransferase Coq5 [Piedraia hortae CBS 480.64]
MSRRPPAAHPPLSPSIHYLSPQTTHFGFTTLPLSEKSSRVASVFTSVASNYDTMNDLMSLGIHRLWKDYFVRSLRPGSGGGQTLLDIAGGTGDIAMRLLDYATEIKGDAKTKVVVSDINPAMLDEGRRRFAGGRYMTDGRVSFLEANAEDLHQVGSGTVDLYTVAFGIRNFTDKDAALREAFRVLKPGGVFACLEFTPRLSWGALNAVYKRWSFGVIPIIGEVVAGDRGSYQYLVESIERFPDQETFAKMVEAAGFVLPGRRWEDLSFGVAAIHKGIKPV